MLTDGICSVKFDPVDVAARRAQIGRVSLTEQATIYGDVGARSLEIATGWENGMSNQRSSVISATSYLT